MMLTRRLLVPILVLAVSHAALLTSSSPRKTENTTVTTAASVTIPKVPIPVRPKGSTTAGSNSKKLAIRRFKLLVSDFFTDAQLSKSIDVAAVGMHKGKSLEKVLDDVYSRLRRMLSTQQISVLTKAQKGLLSDLDEKSAKLLKVRVRRMIVYSFDPAAEQIHKYATKPSMAFALIAETLKERFVGSVKDLIKDVLTAQEYDAFRKHYNPHIFKLDDFKTEITESPKTNVTMG